MTDEGMGKIAIMMSTDSNGFDDDEESPVCSATFRPPTAKDRPNPSLEVICLDPHATRRLSKQSIPPEVRWQAFRMLAHPFLSLSLNSNFHCSFRYLAAFQRLRNALWTTSIPSFSKFQLPSPNAALHLPSPALVLPWMPPATAHLRYFIVKMIITVQQKRLLLLRGAPLMHMDKMSPKTTQARSTSDMTS